MIRIDWTRLYVSVMERDRLKLIREAKGPLASIAPLSWKFPRVAQSDTVCQDIFTDFGFKEAFYAPDGGSARPPPQKDLSLKQR
jgi:hypothetical protein